MRSTAPPTPRTPTRRLAEGWRSVGLQATHLRLAVVQVSLAPPATADGATRRALQFIREGAVQLVRRLDSGSPDDLLHDVCFAARVGLSEVRRELLAEAAGSGSPDLTRARHALYQSLLLTAQVIAANAPAADAEVALDTLRLFVRAAEQASIDEPGWFLDVIDGELTLFTLSAHLTGPLRNQLDPTVLRAAIAAWKRHGRAPELAHDLRASILALTHPGRDPAPTAALFGERELQSAQTQEPRVPALYD